MLTFSNKVPTLAVMIKKLSSVVWETLKDISPIVTRHELGLSLSYQQLISCSVSSRDQRLALLSTNIVSRFVSFTVNWSTIFKSSCFSLGDKISYFTKHFRLVTNLKYRPKSEVGCLVKKIR